MLLKVNTIIFYSEKLSEGVFQVMGYDASNHSWRLQNIHGVGVRHKDVLDSRYLTTNLNLFRDKDESLKATQLIKDSLADYAAVLEEQLK